MSETQYYKTVTFESRVSITVEAALIDYIRRERNYENLVRAEEALEVIRGGGLFEGMKP